MTDTFLGYVGGLIEREGGDRFTNDPADKGGKTKFGITEARARAAGYVGRMEDMQRDHAIAIYRLYFWTQPGFDQIDPLSPALAALMLDLGANFGPVWPGKFLQRALNALNQQASTFPDLLVDGQCGAMTRAALATLLRLRGEDGKRVLLGMIRSQASVRYLEIAEGDASQERYEFGWQLNRAIGAA